TEWTGTASDLLGALGEMAGERVAKSKTWPDTPRALGGRLRRAATFLRKVRVGSRFTKEGPTRTRIIQAATPLNHPGPEQAGAQPSTQSSPSAPMPIFNQGNGFAALDRRTVANDADGRDRETVHTVRANLLESNTGTAADGADANC